MKIAFYAPLKSPHAPTPSGDRLIGGLFMRALALAGHEVELISDFRSYERHGDRDKQQALARQGQREAAGLCAHYAARPAATRPSLMFTYHLYHKAPDWIGPALAKALHIPYVVAEASFAPRQEDGPWSEGHEAVRRALGQTDLVIGLNPKDRACVMPLLPPHARYQAMAPFIDAAPYARAGANHKVHRAALNNTYAIAPGTPLLLVVGMMRAGNKLQSYELLSAALQQMQDRPWHLLVVGGGPARGAVEQAFAPLAARVSWAGTVPPDQLPGLYSAADLFLWPAIREVMGMSVLEAQAAGTPVIVGDAPGILPLFKPGQTGMSAKEGDHNAFAAAITTLLDQPALRGTMSQAASAHITAAHDLSNAANILGELLQDLAPGSAPAATRAPPANAHAPPAGKGAPT